MRMRRRTLVGLVVGAVALFSIANVARTAIAASLMPGFWQTRMREPAPAGAFRLVALGDSAAVGVGADDPMDGFVGRIATYVESVTGRPVHISNVSVNGATAADILRDQLPQVDLDGADLVIVSHDSDLTSGVSVERYRDNVAAVVERLPADRTVYSDIAPLPGADRFQPVLAEVTDAHGIARADVRAIFDGKGRRLDIFSWLPPHLNSRGYYYWFLAFQPAVDDVLAGSQEVTP
jgi:lysophospholipase L1-like esterase